MWGQNHVFHSFPQLVTGTFFALLNSRRVTLGLPAEILVGFPLFLSELNQNGRCSTVAGTVVQYENSLSDSLLVRFEVLTAVLMRFKSRGVTPCWLVNDVSEGILPSSSTSSSPRGVQRLYLVIVNKIQDTGSYKYNVTQKYVTIF
jgi:hypothetical protein